MRAPWSAWWKAAAAVTLGLLMLGSSRPGRALSGPTAHVRLHAGRPVLVVDGRPTFPMIYALTEGGRFTWEENPSRQIRLFAQAGVDLVQVDCWFRDIWTAPGQLDYGFVDRQLAAVRAANPRARVFVRIHVGAPAWWVAAHPDEVVGYAGEPAQPDRGDIDACVRHSLASATWRDEATAMLRLYLRHVRALPEGGRVIGYHVADGVYGEWHYWGFPHHPDTGPAMTRHFRKWLRAKYGSDAALQAAWHDRRVTLDTARPPDLPARLGTTAGAFYGRNQAAVTDYYRCQQAVVADDVLHFCRAVKEEGGRGAITGVFYGYFFSHADHAEGGHLEMERVLHSPDVDYLAGPYSYEYEARRLGGTGQLRAVVESIARHGKLWLSEQDNPTFIGDAFNRGADVRTFNVDDSIATMRRDFCQALTHPVGMWWYDFGPTGNGGWWDDPRLQAEVAQMQRLAQGSLARPYRSVADAAVVFGTESFYHLALPASGCDPVTVAGANRLAAALSRSGVAYDSLFAGDLAEGDLGRYRAVIFANTYALSEQQRAVAARLAGQGKLVIWCYAPGYVGQTGPSLSGLERLTGFRFARTTGPARVQVAGHDWGLPACRLGTGGTATPLFAVTDPQAIALGTLADGRPGMAARQVGRGWSVYCAVPPDDPAVLRCLLRRAGCHVYGDTPDVYYLCAGWLGLHTETAGRRVLHLPRPARITDAFTGQDLGRTAELAVDLPAHRTVLYRVESRS